MSGATANMGEGGFDIAVLGVKGTERLAEELGEGWGDGVPLSTRNDGVKLFGTVNAVGLWSTPMDGELAACISELGDMALWADSWSFSSIYRNTSLVRRLNRIELLANLVESDARSRRKTNSHPRSRSCVELAANELFGALMIKAPRDT